MNRGSTRLGRWLVGFALAGLLLCAAPASATFHLMKVREVYPAGSSSYVMLQLLDIGEFQVGGHHLVAYNANGSVAHDFILPNNVSPSSRNNAMVLITGPGYSTAFPSGPTSNEPDPGLNLSPAGGAVCWVEGEPPDCVAWGNFSGTFPAHTPPLEAGSPASPGGVTSGKALHRSIAPGCATILEAGDDSDDSADDFSEQTPNPRNNASTIVESDCVTPITTIDSKPTNPTRASSAEFTFHSSPAGAQLECKLDSGAFVECLNGDGEPWAYPGPLAEGSHTFQVRGTNSQGTGAAAAFTWLVDTQPPTATIKTSPTNPSTGASAAFTYESSQLGSTFECSLVQQGQGDSFASCPAGGKTYSGLGDGAYAFKVRATDKAGNQGAPAAYSWTVNNAGGGPTLPGIVIPPVVIPRPPVSANPPVLRCKRGFVKKRVKGKMRCVKKKKKKRKR